MNYWLDLFTGATWNEFRQAGARVTGFRATTKGISKQVKPGDIFLCYLTGVMRWVGVLEVLGPSSDRSRIWKFDAFPIRFDVRPLIMLDPEHGVPMSELEGKVVFYAGPEHRGGFKGFVRRSPNRFQHPQDGALVHQLLRQAVDTLRPELLRMLEAFAVEPKQADPGEIGSPSHALSRRLGGAPREVIDEGVQTLNALRLTRMERLHTTMTAHGANDLRSDITPLGWNVLRFLRERRRS